MILGDFQLEKVSKIGDYWRNHNMFFFEILFECKALNCFHFGKNYGNFIRISCYENKEIELYEEFDSMENERPSSTFFRI